MEENEITEENKVQLRELQNRLVRLIEALARLDTNEDWQTLKELVFSKTLASVERQLLIETLNKEVNINKIYKLQGEWVQAKQNVDSQRFIETLKTQLEDVKSKLK